MKPLVALIALALPLIAAPVHASAELAAKNNCLACHDLDKKKVGPAFKDVSAKYKGQKDAAAMRVESMLNGSQGKWGPIPMPAQKIAREDAEKLSKWVLSL
jgi:cytochrome c